MNRIFRMNRIRNKNEARWKKVATSQKERPENGKSNTEQGMSNDEVPNVEERFCTSTGTEH